MLPAPNNNSFPELLTNTPSLDSDATSSEGMFSSWWVWIFIILLLAYLGFNIFNYLAKGAQTTNDVLSPFWAYIMSFFNYGPTSITSSQPDDTEVEVDDKTDHGKDMDDGNSKQGGSKPISAENAKPNTASVSKMSPDSAQNPQGPDNAQNTALNRALNISKQQELSKQDYVANDSYDSTQQGKAGWCYIGSEQGYRSCSQVGEADTCMSGNIFPTQDICVNPSLRA
jgi:hypothetical protein